MARRSVAYNALEDRIDIVTGDIRDASNMFGASSFDVVTCNPPYIAGRRGLLNPEDAMAIARHELFWQPGRCSQGNGTPAAAKRPMLFCTPPVPAGGNLFSDACLSSGTETDAAGVSIF